MYSKKERERYNKDRERVCKKLNITKNQYNWFRREADKLHKVYENNCNGFYISDDKYEMESGVYEGKIVAKCGKLGLYFYFQTDPRGASLYLDTKKIPENNYTQANCIY